MVTIESAEKQFVCVVVDCDYVLIPSSSSQLSKHKRTTKL